MKLTNKKSYITNLSDGDAPTSSKPKLTQLIYFLILLSIAIYIIYIIYQQIVFFKAPGFIEIDKTTISSVRGGKIIKLNIVKGQKLTKGSTIAIVENRQFCEEKEDIRIEKIKFDMAQDRAELNYLQNKLKQLRESELSNSLARAMEINKKLIQLNQFGETPEDELTSKIKLLKYRMKNKRQRIKDLKTLGTGLIKNPNCYNEQIKSPYDAQVSAVQKRPFEVITRSESIMTLIADDADVKIQVYLDIEDHKEVAIGDILTVDLPNDYRSVGVVESIDSSAYNFPERKYEGYKPIHQHIKLYLSPLDKEQKNLWKSFDRMEVKVRGSK